MAREGGKTFNAVIDVMRSLNAELAGQDNAHLAAIHKRFAAGIEALSKAGNWIVATYATDVRATSAGAVPFLMLFGIVAGGWQMARAALIAKARIDGGSSDPFYQAKIITARYFADHLMSRAEGLASSVTDGATGVMALADDQF